MRYFGRRKKIEVPFCKGSKDTVGLKRKSRGKPWFPGFLARSLVGTLFLAALALIGTSPRGLPLIFQIREDSLGFQQDDFTLQATRGGGFIESPSERKSTPYTVEQSETSLDRLREEHPKPKQDLEILEEESFVRPEKLKRVQANAQKEHIQLRSSMAPFEDRSTGAQSVHENLERAPFQLNNGTTVIIPKALSRYHVPWFVPFKTFKLRSLKEANFRMLYSPVRHAMSDGIGHSMAIMNYEVRVAEKLGLAYSHRVSNYSSLTETDVSAVENFFGWGDNVEHTRAQIQREVCVPEGGEQIGWASDVFARRYQCNICDALRPRNNLGMKRIVTMDKSVSYQCVNRTRTHRVCDADVKAFLRKNDKSHTLFQLPTEVCDKPVSDSTFGYTKGYFWHKYWGRHSSLSRMHRGEKADSTTRFVSLSEEALTIAVHVRRGDFIHEASVRQKRVVLEDEAYASLICRVLKVVQDEGTVFSEMPIHVHIFSEGRVIEAGPLSSHSISAQNKVYYDIKGRPRSSEWWMKLIESEAVNQFETDSDPRLKWRDDKALEKVLRRLQVHLRIAEPTLQSMHEMISSDIFIGSKSGLSTNVVWALARGVSLIPNGMPVASEGMFPGPAKERICCTVGFDVHSLRFNVEKFRIYWHAYARANAESAATAFSRKLLQTKATLG